MLAVVPGAFAQGTLGMQGWQTSPNPPDTDPS